MCEKVAKGLYIWVQLNAVLILSSIFKQNLHWKGRRFVLKQDQPQPHVRSNARTLSPKL